jgi:hypothetical protein
VDKIKEFQEKETPLRRAYFCFRSTAPLLLAMVAWLAGIALAVEQPAVLSRPPRLHALFIIDTIDSNIAAGVMRDRDSLVNVFRDSFDTRPHRLNLRLFEGNDANKETVLGYLKSLGRGDAALTPEDTLFVYYSGHGANLAREQGHYLLAANEGVRPKEQWLARAELLDNCRMLKPQLLALLTDCCDNVLDRHVPFKRDRLPRATWPVIESLFFQAKGESDINSCPYDSFAWTHNDKLGNGAVFTYELARLLCTKREDFRQTFNSRSADVDWRDFAKALSNRTNSSFQDLREQVFAAPDLVHGADLAKLRNQFNQLPRITQLATPAPRDIRDAMWLFGTEVGNRTDGARGIRVVDVAPGTPAYKAEFRRSDDIFKVDGIAINNIVQFYRHVDTSSGAITVEGATGGKTWTRRVELKLVKPVAMPREPASVR